MALDLRHSDFKAPLEFADTHCHIHEAADVAGDQFVHDKWAVAGVNDPRVLVDEASRAGVNRLICVGTTLIDSELAVKFVQDQPKCWASVGLHPHEAGDYTGESEKLKAFAKLAAKPKVVAIGECGLDYYYAHSTKEDQRQILEFQLELAQKHDLPLIFHVRDAFSDFWPIVDNFKSIRGVIHSFSSDIQNLEQILSRGFYVGLNGIMTFTKNKEQLFAAKAIPLSNLLLETDAPFLTPVPYRGTICKPMHVVPTAEFLAGLRGETMAEIAHTTTKNACDLFVLK